MTQMISIKPSEQGTAIVTIAPTDEDDAALTIAQLTDPSWQLMRTSGTIINNRSFANCSLSSLTFTLTGDDLAIFSSDRGNRVLSFHATYDSTAGSNLPINAECRFSIDKLLGQADV